MPAKSVKQKRFFGIAESIKKGKTSSSYSPSAAKAAKTMKLKSIRHFTKTKESGLPERVKKTQVASKKNPFSFRDLIKKTRTLKKKRGLIMEELFPDETQTKAG
jgi:hypothetical protein